MKRPRRRWWILALILIVIAAGATAAVLLLTGGKAAAVQYLTSTVTKGTITKSVQADFTLAASRSTRTLTVAQASSSSTSSTTSGTSGVVTNFAFPAGKAPHTLQRLLTVSGSRLYAFVSPSPLFEDLSTSLSSGKQVANVKALQRALEAAGYYSGAVDGTFGSSTAVALEDWQSAQNLTVSGTLDISKFVWVPRGSVISDWQVNLGSAVSGATPLATAYFPRQLEAQALVGQADISSLKKGQAAQLTVDGHTKAIAGKITSISQQPSSSASGTGASTVQYTITLRLRSVPSYAKVGMTGSLDVTIAQRKNVLVVPTRAITGSSTTSYVRVLMNGQVALRQVQTGMATASSTEIAGGLAVGETVITGTLSTGTSASSGGSLFGAPCGGFPGGGTFRRSISGGSTSAGGTP
jgi:peptidoglycan hydrolase-like protein with peptidoglycan-binding domain